MKMNRAYFILFIATIAFAAIGCYKNDHRPMPTEPGVLVTTIAGNGSGAYANGAALSASFNGPSDVAVDVLGNIYVADKQNHRIRRIAGGAVTTIAGNDTLDILNGRGELARFGRPNRIEVDSMHNLYVLDETDPRIRRIAGNDNSVTTYAGTQHSGYVNGDTSVALFQLIAGGIVINNSGGDLFISDSYNSSIRKVSKNGSVTTLAGTGNYGYVNGDPTIAQFSLTAGIALDVQKNIYVSDAERFNIRKITPAGVVTKFSGNLSQGTRDGDAATAQFNVLGDMVADAHGNLYVADKNCIRKITPDGTVTTIAGNSNAPGYVDGDGRVARFDNISGLGIDIVGSLYVADANNNRIRKITFQ